MVYNHVYGISGYKGHGKDFFARLLVKKSVELEKGHSFVILHFADELKRLCMYILGFSEGQVYDQELKEVPLVKPLNLDAYVEALREHTGLYNINYQGKIARTPREALQFIGTEYVRKARDSYWVDKVLEAIPAHGYALIPDTRFPNEAAALRGIGGRVIHISRVDLPESTDGHASETEIKNLRPDLFLGTITDDFRLQERIATELLEGRFPTEYDYRTAQRMRKNEEKVGFLLDYYKGRPVP
jgi:hypothetical protein